ncbi:MAG TPA: polysaccharide deacetylase family protein [Bacillota bacterium]|nr:polysaccharide deacetylase family protein [Bacillota bacterium]
MKKSVWLLVLVLIVMASCNDDSSKQRAEQADNMNANKREIAEDAPSSEAKEHKGTKDVQYKVSNSWHIIPIDEEANEKVVLLTIDDAPDRYALEMAKTLHELEAGAIFFVNGMFLETEEKKKILKDIHDMGFLIGNHTYSHAFLPDLSKEEQKEEIVRVNDVVEEIIGERPAFFRAPNGANTDFTKQIADEEDMVLMNWVYGYDWEPEYQSQEALTEIMLNTPLLENGANLLMHDREWTAEALEDIVKGLRDKGFEIVDPALIQTKQ